MFRKEENDDVRETKKTFAIKAIQGFMYVALPTLIASLSRTLYLGWSNNYIVYILGASIPYILYLFKDKLKYETIIIFAISILTIVAFTSFANYSFFGLGMIYLFFAVLLSVIFFGKKLTLVLLSVFVVGIITNLILFKLNIIVYKVDFNEYNQLVPVWLTQITGLLLLSMIGINLFGYYNVKLKSIITDTRQKSIDLEIAKKKAEESDDLKTAFLRNMTHEIRTPLNQIVGFTQLLKHENLSPEEVQDYSEFIKESSNRLIETINNVLEMSKIKTNQFSINIHSFHLNTLMNDLYDSFYSIANKRKLKLSLDMNIIESELTINSDQIIISRILSNFLSNAIKFTHDGEVSIGYVLNKEEISFFVKDTGIGINQELHDKIFNLFHQLDSSISRTYEGIGLGLTISKELVSLLNGKIWVESEEGVGSTFWFSLPINNEKGE